MRKMHAIVAICISAVTVPMADRATALDQITACVEVSVAAVPQFANASSTRTDCNPQLALARAISQAQKNAAAGLRDFCRANITAAIAAATCAAHGLNLPSAANTQARLAPVATAGSPAIDYWRGIGRTTAGPLCTVVRDLPNETRTSTEAEILCVLNNFRRTIFIARARVRCAVQCL